MTRFHIEMIVVCPSDWTQAKCREWVERGLSSDRERDSLTITPLPPVDPHIPTPALPEAA